MQITSITFNGTADEFKSVAHLFSQSKAVNISSEQAIQVSSPSGAVASKDIIRTVLARKSISPAQRELFKVLYAAGDDGLKKSEIAIKTQRTDKEINGVLGALGRRINNSSSELEITKPGIELLLNIEHTADNEWLYCLRPEFREVLDDLSPDWLHN